MTTNDTGILFTNTPVRKGQFVDIGFKMDTRQKRQWVETRSALLWVAPAFSHIYYTMMVGSLPDGVVWSREVPTAATDGKHLILNPDKFFEYPLAKRVFIVAHEICHAMLDHCGQFHGMRLRGWVQAPDGRKLKFDQKTLNISADLIINDMLIASNIGQYDPAWLHDTKVATHMDGVPTVYAKVFDEQQGGASGQGQGQGKGQGQGQGQGRNGQQQFDEHLDPGTSEGKDASKAQAERSQPEWDTAIAAGVASAKAQGKLPAAMERFFTAVLDPAVEWQDHIAALFARKVGYGGTTWTKPDRRLICRDIYAPGRTGNGANIVVIGADSSGSMGQREFDVIFAELRGILEDVRPEAVYVLWCDSKVHGVQEVHDVDDLSSLKPMGGGGTDFRPVFDWVAKNLDPSDISALVYITDLYGSFPAQEPSYPVIWGRTTTQAIPFGDVVDIPVKG